MSIIFYSISGEGLGHATRSEVVINHLLSRGYKVMVFTYSRAYDYLKKSLSKKRNLIGVKEICGINLVYENNEFKLRKTVIKESLKLKDIIFTNFRLILKEIFKYSPNIIIGDFEPSLGFLARILKIPFIEIDNNISLITTTYIPKYIKLSPESKMLKYLYKSFYNADAFLLVDTFNLKIKKEYSNKVRYLGSVIRKEIVECKREKKNFILVYQTSTTYLDLIKTLREFDEKFIVYRFNKRGRSRNIIFKKEGKKHFLDDLRKCKAIITNGGFSLISEAIFLKKPIYTIPVKNQVEQEFNSYWVHKRGFGMKVEEVGVKSLSKFINSLRYYENNLMMFKTQVNNLEIVDSTIRKLEHRYRDERRRILLKKIDKKLTDLRGKMFRIGKVGGIDKIRKLL